MLAVRYESAGTSDISGEEDRTVGNFEIVLRVLGLHVLVLGLLACFNKRNRLADHSLTLVQD